MGQNTYSKEDLLKEPYSDAFVRSATADGRFVQGAVTLHFHEALQFIARGEPDALYESLSQKLLGSDVGHVVDIRLVGCDLDRQELWLEVTVDARPVLNEKPLHSDWRQDHLV